MSDRLLAAAKGLMKFIDGDKSITNPYVPLVEAEKAITESDWSPDPPTEPGWYWCWEPGCREPIREYWTDLALALAAAGANPRPGRHWRPSPVPEPPAWPTGQDDTPPPRPAHGCTEFSATMGLDGIYRLKCAECGRVHEARLQPSPVTADEDTADFTPNLKG